MGTKGLGCDTADTRVMMPVVIYEAAQRIARKQLLSYSNWAARQIWKAVQQDTEEGGRLRDANKLPTER